MTKLDPSGTTFHIAGDGMIKIDGVTVFRKTIRNSIVYIQFCDHDRMRSHCRGNRFIEIPLVVLMERLGRAGIEFDWVGMNA